jgi:hypothetical protein
MSMAAISTHLHHRPYQVATATDLNLPHRKWRHHGTFRAPTHRSAAYDVYKGIGNVIDEFAGPHGIIYRFSCGLFVCVGL